MDEFAMFAQLRPDDALTEIDLEQLRAELFDGQHGARPEPMAPTDDAVPPGVVATAPIGRRLQSRLVLAAAALAAIGFGGLWLVSGRDNPSAPAVATQPEPSLPDSPPTSADSAYDVPIIGFDQPGWTLTSASDATYPMPRAVVLLSDAGFDGPWIEITADTTDSADSTDSTVPSGDSSVDVNGETAQVTEIENGAILQWGSPDGRAMTAFGWQVDVDQVLPLLADVTVTDVGITLGNLPAGAILADTAARDALGRYVGYRFTNDDGREVEVNFRAGGARGLYQLVGPSADFEGEGRTAVMVGEEPATIVHYDEASPDSTLAPATAQEVPPPTGRYRLDVQRGFFTWQFDTAGFRSEQEVIDLVAGASAVDESTWAASVADNIVLPADRAARVDELVAGVPLPPGFDAETLSVGGTSDRYQLIVEVSGAVACGWFDDWFAGRSAGDTERVDRAATALATSRQWQMLQEIADQGGWSDGVWEYVDALSGADTLDATTQRSIDSGLGCDRFD